jgi:hypothetical protein
MSFVCVGKAGVTLDLPHELANVAKIASMAINVAI